uniref:GTC903 n=1 Tax=Arundo donax TaxID=35708 RepID=A0A0A9GEF7_ARUDO
MEVKESDHVSLSWLKEGVLYVTKHNIHLFRFSSRILKTVDMGHQCSRDLPTTARKCWPYPQIEQLNPIPDRSIR